MTPLVGLGRRSFLFEEKEGTEEKPFWRKTAFFEKGWCGGGGAWSRRIGHNEADPPIECMEGAWRKVGVFVLQPFPLGWRESRRGGTSQAFPWKGKGDRRRRWMRLIKIKRREKVSSSVAIPSVTAGGHAVPPPLAKGEAALRASPIERAYKNRAVHDGQAFLWKGKGDHRSAMVDEVDQ